VLAIEGGISSDEVSLIPSATSKSVATNTSEVWAAQTAEAPSAVAIDPGDNSHKDPPAIKAAAKQGWGSFRKLMALSSLLAYAGGFP
jgi:hypothetical protein